MKSSDDPSNRVSVMYQDIQAETKINVLAAGDTLQVSDNLLFIHGIETIDIWEDGEKIHSWTPSSHCVMYVIKHSSDSSTSTV